MSGTSMNLWPNQRPIPDGVVPISEVSQDPMLLADDKDDLRMELEA